MKIKIKCDFCDRWFKTNECWVKKDNKKHHFCDRKCQGKWKSKNNRAENNPNFKHGETLKKHYCIDCKIKEINYKCFRYGGKRCKSCSKKYLYYIGKLYLPIMYGKDNPRWKGGKPKCKKCKRELSRYKFILCQKCYLETINGKNNPNYKHGMGNEPYPLDFNYKLKIIIRKRDNYTCQNCDMTEEEHLIARGRVLDIHHIDYNKENIKENNLITTCQKCNLKANSNRDYWFAYFSYINIEKK